MNNDMLPVGSTIKIKPEDIKWDSGDLISREALKEKAETVTLWNGDVRRFVSYETIDNAPAVSDRYYEGYAQGYIHGSTGADWQGE